MASPASLVITVWPQAVVAGSCMPGRLSTAAARWWQAVQNRWLGCEHPPLLVATKSLVCVANSSCRAARIRVEAFFLTYCSKE
jgi:hypothetical protein